jgi:hypothetical protein
VVLLFALTGLVAGCGNHDSEARGAGTTSTTSSSTATTTATTGTEASAATTAQPGRVAVAQGMRLDALVDAYAPVTTRASFLVAAETLRSYALNNDGTKDQIQEYAGSVRLELRRTSAVLVKARVAVAAQETPDAATRRLQVLLLKAVADRTHALTQLTLLLQADALPATTSDARKVLQGDWRTAWDTSVRDAREATTSMQDTREAAGLDPAPEDGIR